MLNVAVAEVGLQSAGVVALVGQGIAASMPKHVRVRLERQLGLPARPLDHAGEPSCAERCPAFRREHKRRLRFLLAQKPPQRPQFIPEDRMGAGRAFLDPADVQGRGAEIHLIPAQVHQFRHAQAMPVSREDHRGIPLAPAVALGSFHQPLDFGLGQVFAGAKVGVWNALGDDCAIYGGWRDQLEVRLGHTFCPSGADDCS